MKTLMVTVYRQKQKQFILKQNVNANEHLFTAIKIYLVSMFNKL